MTSEPAKRIAVRVVRLKHGTGLPLPDYQSEGAAGLDLLAAVDTPVDLAPGQRALIPTGLIFSLPANYEAQVRPRSGLALKHGITVLNSPGTIDSDYRGEVKILLVNLGEAPFTVRRGERIAQLVIAPVTQADLEVSETLGETKRGAGGFGSTSTVEGGKATQKKAQKQAQKKAAPAKREPAKEKPVPARTRSAQQTPRARARRP